MTTPGRPRVLMVAMYPLDTGLWGATTRIIRMRDALASQCRLEVVSGGRRARGWKLLNILAAGRLRGIDGIYVETATTLPGPIDLAFVAAARARSVPVVSYVRDAQPLFPEYYRADTIKRRVSRVAFLPLTRALIRLSTRTCFPSRGLAAAVTGSADAELLPPGSRVVQAPPPKGTATSLLYVGPMRLPAHGSDILISGVGLARSEGHNVDLICVTRRGDEPAMPLPAWARMVRAEGSGIEALLPDVVATVLPYRRTPYNDLAVPIKLMEYLGFGRPVIVTDLAESAAIVRKAGCGVIVTDTVEGIAAGIGQIMRADGGQLRTWSEAGRAAAMANSWDLRAIRVLELLDLPREKG